MMRGEERQHVSIFKQRRDALRALTLVAIGELVEIRIEVCRLAQQRRGQLFAKAFRHRNELIVASGHAIAQRLGVGDSDVGKITRRQPYRRVPATVRRVNANSDEQSVHEIETLADGLHRIPET